MYQAGLEIGDTDRACWCLMKRCCYLYFISRDLGSVQKELEATIHVLTQLKQDDTKLHIIILLMTVKKLRGLDVEAGDENLEFMLASTVVADNFALSAYVDVMKLEVFVFNQEWR